MATLITTAGAADANSYQDLVGADTYLDEHRLHASEWSTASTANKIAALLWATQILDEIMDWFGAPRTLEQNLDWPRVGVVTDDGKLIDEDTVPKKVADATAALAWELIKSDRLQDPSLLGKGIKSLKLDVISITVDPREVLDLVPHYIEVMLNELGRLKPNLGRGTRIVPIVRS